MTIKSLNVAIFVACLTDSRPVLFSLDTGHTGLNTLVVGDR